MYEIEHYCSSQHRRRRGRSRGDPREAPTRSARCSSRRRCRSTERARTGTPSGDDRLPGACGPRTRCARHDFEHHGARTRRSRPSARPRIKPLVPTSIYAVTKRDHEEMFLATGAAYGMPGGRAALLQHLRHPAVALEPVHGRRRDLLVAPAEPPPAHDLRGRPARAATSSTFPTSCARTSRRWRATPPNGRVFNVGTGRSTSVLQVAETLAKELGFDEPARCRRASSERVTSGIAMRTRARSKAHSVSLPEVSARRRHARTARRGCARKKPRTGSTQAVGRAQQARGLTR